MTVRMLGVALAGLVMLAGCHLEGTVTSLDVSPAALTAGSRETLFIEATALPAGNGGMFRTAVGLEFLDSGGRWLPDEWIEGFYRFWGGVFDDGTRGDAIAGDFVFTHEGLHPFVQDFPPGTYVLRTCSLVPGACDAGNAEYLEATLEILPP